MSAMQANEILKYMKERPKESYSPKKMNGIFGIENSGSLLRKLFKNGKVTLRKGCYKINKKEN